MDRSWVTELFYNEPAGTFAEGYLLQFMPDLTRAVDDPHNGYWHCNLANHDRLTWSEKVYELFGLPAGTTIEREWVVERYTEHSKKTLDEVRTTGIKRKMAFILDAEITPSGERTSWIRVLAVPILAAGQLIGLHGLKRAIQ